MHKFDWRQVPKDVFDQYFELRKEISDVAVHKMGRAGEDVNGSEWKVATFAHLCVVISTNYSRYQIDNLIILTFG